MELRLLTNWLLRLEEYLGLFRWASVITGVLKVEEGSTRAEWCDVMWELTFAVFKDGEREPGAKERGQPFEARKNEEWILPSAYSKECSPVNLLILPFWQRKFVLFCGNLLWQQEKTISSKQCSRKMGKGCEQAITIKEEIQMATKHEKALVLWPWGFRLSWPRERKAEGWE